MRRSNCLFAIVTVPVTLSLCLFSAAPVLGDGGDLWALGNATGDGGAPMELYTLDKTTAASTFVVSTGTVGLRGLAMDPTSGRVYSAYGGIVHTAKRGIVEVNPSTGAVTDIGGTRAFVALAFDLSGQLYGAENSGLGLGNVYKIDKTTGAETYLATVPPDGENPRGPGLAFDNTTDTLYYKGWPGGLWTVDTTSGATAFLGLIFFPWYASHSFDFNEFGDAYYHQHPCSGCGDGLAFALSTDLRHPWNLGFSGVRVWGLTYGRGIPVAIDIKFCSDPNALNCKKKGVLPVTIFGTDTFNVADIDISTLQLCTADLSACTNAPRDWSTFDRGTPEDAGVAQCDLDPTTGEELDFFIVSDGYLDLDAAFEASEVKAILGDFCDDAAKGDVSQALVIIGETYDGIPIYSVPADDNTGIDRLVKANN